MEVNEIAFNLILYSGNARSKVMEALKLARLQFFDNANEMLKEADEELEKAHKVQTNMMQEEAKGGSSSLSILLVHAQDHLMTAMLARDLSEEIIDLRQSDNKQ
ncbi:PTS lactose/cellobiose transporter subunit IIA [Virgibacillus sp. NKC19-3]|uniref:PTS lactose/cellobiose transporter subunit IIA n=1 Tax=Virgibacillus saliphilus TaxID=2831674 RepID=UPI001C9A4385|nr:PTS lactose/cellobiose transporter subunit IIA [Virgibacillus sp. NKC19-3]MBY7144487.1 PTS lactose/cellobiose transporter subunit IIA [Virgibacillus sp. NKC19-3]